jgi:hypothetical protein
MNEEAFKQLTNLEDEDKKKKIVIVSGATYLFEESGKLEEVAQLARDWFDDNLE